MPRARSPKRDEAYQLWIASEGKKKLKDIAAELGVSETQIRKWKNQDKWNGDVTNQAKGNVTKRKRGGQPGNKNAVGHGAPKGNQNATKHGLFSRYLPEDTRELFFSLDSADPLDLLWDQIKLAYAAIMRAQYIMHVRDRNDKTVEKVEEKDGNVIGERWEVQQAWDKQASFLQAQAKAQKELTGMIKQYEELLHKNWDLATKEQKARIKKIKADIKTAVPDKVEEKEYSGIPASMIAPVFAPVLFDIREHKHTEYVFPGGRGSTKSSFISLNIIDLIMTNPEMHAVVMRQVADTMRGSVYQQILWAIDALGLTDEFHATVSPMEITRKSTGQKIYFRGADDPGKVKSIKVPFGYIGILWLEELDQFTGPESVRKIEQSVIRGGDVAYIFKSFNPPKTVSNWANKYIKVPKESRLVTYSTYKDVPEKWLGKPFLEEAEFLKEVNPDAYENEYLGVANGSGGSVFDNITIRQITDAEIFQFDRVLNGVDWGWYPDLYAFVRVHYDAARLTLYIWQEYTCNKKSNRQTADQLAQMGITSSDLITCDSAEEKSVGDYKSYGLFARPADKGPGSREYSYKWLQSLKEIVIDNVRCPVSAEEFLDYEYDRNKDGNVISGYPDGNDHCIDAVRYATNRIWKRRGE